MKPDQSRIVFPIQIFNFFLKQEVYVSPGIFSFCLLVNLTVSSCIYNMYTIILFIHVWSVVMFPLNSDLSNLYVLFLLISICCCSVPKLCPTLCNLMDLSMPGSPALRYLPEFAQSHVHRVGDAI